MPFTLDPNLIVDAEQVITWFIDGILAVKEDNALAAQLAPIYKLALSENRPLTDAERAQVNALAQAEHDAAHGTG